MLDASGHVKLTDFGLSKEYIGMDERTNTFCGTIEVIQDCCISPKLNAVGSFEFHFSNEIFKIRIV
jgi:hypothetical protein